MTEAIREHAEALSELAESDLPCSWLAELLLELGDERGDEK